MKKERIKNIVLTALVLCSLLLTGKIWLNETLWPDGYHFFAQLRENFSSLFAPAQSDSAPNLLFPSQMIAYTVKNSDHASYVVTTSNEYYDTVNDFCEETIKNALLQPAKSIVTVDETTWKNALFTNGMYIDYGSSIPSNVFCTFFGVGTQAEFSNITNNVRYVIITAEGSLVSDIAVYLRNTDGVCYKITTNEPKTALSTVLSHLNEYVTPNNRFSFFIGADTATSDMGEVLFNPYLLLTETETELPQIEAENPILQQDNGMSIAKLERLLQLCSMNPKTARRYTDADESMIFLQNQSTLKISPTGYVEYSAAAGRSGFALPEMQNSADIALGSIRFVYDVFEIFSEARAQLYMRDYTTDNTQSTISFDYNVNGMKVITDSAGAPAAIVHIQNGYVQKFSLHLRTYRLAESVTVIPSTYTAVDRMFTTIDTKEKNAIIENMFIGYYDNGRNGIKQPTWFMQLSGEDRLRTMAND